MSNSAKKLLLKHLARAPRYAVKKALQEAQTQDERDAVKRIADAIGLKTDDDGGAKNGF